MTSVRDKVMQQLAHDSNNYARNTRTKAVCNSGSIHQMQLGKHSSKILETFGVELSNKMSLPIFWEGRYDHIWPDAAGANSKRFGRSCSLTSP